MISYVEVIYHSNLDPVLKLQILKYQYDRIDEIYDCFDVVVDESEFDQIVDDIGFDELQ